MAGSLWPISIRPLPTFGVSKVFPEIQQRPLSPIGIAEKPPWTALNQVPVQSLAALLWFSLPIRNSLDPLVVCVLCLETEVLETLPLLYHMSTVSLPATDSEQKLKTPCHC